ncbi:MAG: NAD(P)-dependent alcohol dehydrogenase [Candidatus Mariimomonas ferrooxydans]
MKAIITKAYGPVEVLEIQEVEKPVIQDNEMLIRVHASSVNPVDWKIRRGDVKLLTGRKPPEILGADYSGTIVKAGKDVKNYKIGDAVFGLVHAFKGGAYAEFVKVKEEDTCPKPENLSFEQAASLPVVSLTAYQSLVHKGQLRRGHHVMVNGCSGGVGLSGVQIAKGLGCRVTGVCSTKNIEVAKKIGADNIIDYTCEDILKDKGAYDIFFDAVANQSFFKAKKTLKPGGIYITTLPSFQSMVLAPFINVISSRKIKKIMVSPGTKSAKDLNIIREMAERGNLIPVLEKIYPIEEIREAHAHSETGRVVGEIALKGF